MALNAPTHRSRRSVGGLHRPSFGRGCCLRAAYVAGTLCGVGVLYGCSESWLYRRDGWNRATPETDAAVEFLVWACALAAAVAYFLVQGSSPGYIARGSALGKLDAISGAPAAAEAGVGEEAAALASGAAPRPSTAVAAVAAAAAAVAAAAPAIATSEVTLDVGVGAGAAAAASAPAPPMRPPRRRAHDAGDSGLLVADDEGDAEADAAAAAAERRARADLSDTDFEEPKRVAGAAGTVAAAGGVADGTAADGTAAAAAAGASPAELAAAARGWRECKWCHAQQPRRAHHCRVCDRCVATFDHHCVALGTCVGERNRARFWLFLLLQSLALTVAIGLLNTAYVWRRTWQEWFGANGGVLVAHIVFWLMQLLVFGLWVFHCWLAATNTTSFETAAGARRLWYLYGTEPKDCDLPFSRGLAHNLRLFFCCVLDGCGSGPPAAPQGAGGAAAPGARLRWAPHEWPAAVTIDRESDNVCENVWETRYWSCC